MAQIDPSIAMGFRPPQIESPINQMAAMAQLQGLRQQQEQNALKLQEYQQLQQEQNALAKLYGDRSLEFGSDEFLRRAAVAAPRSFEGIATRAAQRENLLAQREAREAETAKREFDLKTQQANKARENFQTAVGELINYNTVTEVVDDIYQKEVAGEITPQQAAALRAKLPKDDAGLDSWRIATMRGLLPPKEQFAEIKAKQDETYNNYRVSEIFAGRVPLSRENYERQTAPAAAPVDATAAPAAAPVDATAAPAEATTAADGTKTFSGVTKVGTKQGFDYLDLTAQQLLQLAATAKTDKEAAAYKAAAEKIQAAHVKALEDQQKRGQLTGEFFNVELARQKVQALKKLPSTPDIVEQIDDLLAMIKTAKEGKATKVNVGVKLPPQEQEFEKELGSGQAKDVLKTREQARDARDMLDTVNIGRNILKSGAITGAGADFFVGLNQALKTAGVDFGYADASANSQAYTANMAQNVGKLIKLFGAGTGLSNADRDYAEKMAGGKIALDKTALQKILDIQDRAARNVIKRHNENVKDIKSKTNLTVEIDEAPAAPGTIKPYSNAEKERRYQEFKAKQGGN